MLARLATRVACRPARVPLVRALSSVGGGHDVSATGKGERRRVRQFRKEYVPATEQRAVRLPEAGTEEGEIPRDVLSGWLDYVQKGVDAMASSNPGLEVTRAGPFHLVVSRTGQSLFQLYLDEGGTRLVVISPAKTGTMAHYRWDESTELFVSVIDGHNALELLSRDLIYTLNGVPDF